MKILSSLLMMTALSAPAFATDQVEDLMTQITFSGKAGDTKVFSSDAETMLEIGLKFPAEFAELMKDSANIYWLQMRQVAVPASTDRTRVNAIETTFYASNQLCKHMFCTNPKEADFRILKITRKHTCDQMADGGCRVSYESNGMKIQKMDSLFWLGKKALE